MADIDKAFRRHAENVDRLVMLFINGLTADGAHHKQWFLEQLF